MRSLFRHRETGLRTRWAAWLSKFGARGPSGAAVAASQAQNLSHSFFLKKEKFSHVLVHQQFSTLTPFTSPVLPVFSRLS